MHSFLLILSLFLTTDCLEHPHGHKKPLGSHTKPWNIEVLDDFPNPTEFYHDYVKTGRPVLFKGVLNSGGFPAYQKWTDDYLSEKYGSEDIAIESGKKETRIGYLKERKMSEFLETYRKENIYMVQDVLNVMKSEIGVPRCLQSGGFQKQITTSVLWFSSGGTKSVLHLDTYDNINCLLDGRKELVMFEKVHRSSIEADDFVADEGYSRLDVDSVDLFKTPRISYLPWFKAAMSKGDCLFIPYRWYHQVNSFGTRNFAVNMWFNHMLWFNSSDSGNEGKLKQFIPLDKIKMAQDDEIVRHAMLDSFLALPHITPDDLRKGWGQSADLFNVLDLNKDSVLTWDELYLFNVQDYLLRFKSKFTEIDEFLWEELENLVLKSVQKGSVESRKLLDTIHSVRIAMSLTGVTSHPDESKNEL